MRNVLLIGGVSAAGYYYYTSVYDVKKLAKSAVPASKVFTGGDQGFVSLRLDKVENINHNTKMFRFVFDDPAAVSGMNVACSYPPCEVEHD
jgi:cytochrome-b5 reductase